MSHVKISIVNFIPAGTGALILLGAGVEVITGTPILGCFEDLIERLTAGTGMALFVGMDEMLDRLCEKLKELECTVGPEKPETALLLPRIS